jgi:hypothetical protein
MRRRPAPPRVRALGSALRREQSIGPFSIPVVVGLGSGFLASFAVDALLFDSVTSPMRQFIDAVAFALVAAPAWIAVQRGDIRDAHDAVSWLNAWETERWQTELGRRLPSLPRAIPNLVDVLPDTMGLRPLRVELLAVQGRLTEAEERLRQLPTDTGWQRFERAALDEWLSFLHDGPELLEPMRRAVAEVEDSERRLVARASVALAEARRAAIGGGDAVTPLATIRPALGDRPNRYAFSYRTGIIVSVALIAIVATLAVTLTAAIIR